MSKSPDQLFKELDDFISNSDYEEAINVCNKILSIEPNDPDASICKCVALIHLSKFDEAIKEITNSPQSSQLMFEKAYCYYRQKQLDEALKILKSYPSPKPQKALELEAQVYYRLEDYDNCIKIYQELITVHKVNSSEIKTNLCAAYVGASNAREGDKLITANKSSIRDSYEFAYNAGCAAIESGDYETAEQYLKVAQDICRATLTEDKASESEIQDEIAIMRTQLAFIYQMQNKTEEAIKIYNDVINLKPSDESVSAVASNNIVVIKKQHHLFDSFKKLKQATSLTFEQKLSNTQKKIIGFNRCLILLYMNKVNECRELVNMMQEQFPDSDRLALINAALLYKEKKIEQSEDLLKAFADKYPKSSLRVKLSLAQIYLSRGNISETIKILESINELKNKPGMVATLVSLYEQASSHGIEGAIKVFDDFCTFVEKKDEEEYVRLLKENAKLKLKYKKHKEAATSLERVAKLRPNDLEALANLVVAFSQYDPVTAERYENKLPKMNLDSSVNAEALENLAAPKSKQDDQEQKSEVSTTSVEEEKKKKKKKKNPKPKNFDANKQPDPERWIPMKMRSYYKAKRNRRNKGLEKGAQGTVERKPIATATTPAAAPASPTPAPKATAQQPTGGNKKKGKN